jgi:Protein of unknown function (DUF2750)
VAWEANDEEFASVLALPANCRYGYFIKRAASHGEVWSLRGDGGWVVAADDQDNPHFPVWHTRVSPRPALKGRGRGRIRRGGDRPMGRSVASQTRKGRDAGHCLQTPEDQGVGVAPLRLKRDLEDELSQFELLGSRPPPRAGAISSRGLDQPIAQSHYLVHWTNDAENGAASGTGRQMTSGGTFSDADATYSRCQIADTRKAAAQWWNLVGQAARATARAEASNRASAPRFASRSQALG